MTSTKKVLLALLAVLAMFAAACGSDEAEVTASATDDSSTDDGDAMDDAADVKAAFVMVAPVGDAGWNFMHNEGRLGAEAATGVETAFVESVPEGGAEFDAAVQQFIDDGYNVIFATSFGYQDATLKFANENPDVVFEHVSG
ncbi:MAG: BMP family ABC transporter substrate-binding protein, partial [Acidimicrobiia bacterium]|nr:BMP family ABC transporter substrate-binding protein [Acidimicrobiia bacterium]